jgi:hypothetical protein
MLRRFVDPSGHGQPGRRSRRRLRSRDVVAQARRSRKSSPSSTAWPPARPMRSRRRDASSRRRRDFRVDRRRHAARRLFGRAAIKRRRPTLIHAGARKVDGNPYQKLTDEVKAELKAEIDRFYDLFVSSVAVGRKGMTKNNSRDRSANLHRGRRRRGRSCRCNGKL